MPNKEIRFLWNVLIVAKFYIHKCRFVEVSPCFTAFKNYVRTLFKSIFFLGHKSVVNGFSNINACLLFEGLIKQEKKDFYFGLVMWRHKAAPRSCVCNSAEER